jgi:hypothetical protein
MSVSFPRIASCALIALAIAHPGAALAGSAPAAKTVPGVQLKPKIAPVNPTVVGSDGNTRLQGGTAVYQSRDPYLEFWRANQLYQQGGFAMYIRDYPNAAEFFKQCGDIFELNAGDCRLLAESRFAEATARRMMAQVPQAAKLYQLAADIFRRTDPNNPYLQASLQNIMLMGYVDKPAEPPKKKKLVASATMEKFKMVAMQPRKASIDRTLQGQCTKLEDGTLVAALHDEDFFDGSSKKFLAQTAAVDLSDKFLKGAVYNAFHEMTCLEFAALGANYLTATDVYKPFLSEGKPILVGASEDIWKSPNAKITINGKEFNVPMTLPGISQNSFNVLLVTDGEHVLAIDPRKNDIWKLMPVLAKAGASDFNWWKLTHTKKQSIPTGKVKTASPFGR